MSTNINISSDLNNYLKTSGSSLNNYNNNNNQSSSSSQTSKTTTKSIKEWFDNNANGTAMKGWFTPYQPLRTSPSDDNLDKVGIQSNGSSSSSWFRIPFISNQPEQPKGLIPTLTRTQRIIGFIACFFMGLTCFSISVMYIPILLFAARKFSILFTFGSIFIVASFAILLGPWNHLKNQFSKERLPFTAAYFGSLIATLYFALAVQSTLLTSLFAIIQVIALIWYVFTYIPGGQTGLMFFSKMAASTVSKTLPV